jgi:nitroreductase
MPFKALKRLGKGKKIEEVEEPVETIDTSQTFCSLIKNRRSVRRYQEKDIEDDILENILDSAACAPSAGNHQPWEFIVVRKHALRNDLAEASYNQKWIAQAPVLIVACVNNRLAGSVYGERGLRLYGIQAVAAAIENILLSAESLGLGSCWVGAFSEFMVARILQCPKYVRPCAIITLGYPAESPQKPHRQDMEEYVHCETFGETIHLSHIKEERKPTYMKFQ